MLDPDGGLLRGTLDVLILKALTWGPRHGYAVAEWVKTITEGELLVEEGPRRQAGVRHHSDDAATLQLRLDPLKKRASDATPGATGVSEKKVEVAVVVIGGKASYARAGLDNDGVKRRQSLLPACKISFHRRPGLDLFARIVSGRELVDGSGIGLDNFPQVG